MMPFRRVVFLNSGYCTQWAYLAGRRSWGLTRFHAVFVYLEHPEHGAALIDTGYSPWFFQESRRFPQRLYRWATPVSLDARQDPAAILAAHGLTAAPIERVFISHFHGDHIAGLRCFPSARFVFRSAAHEALMRESPWRQVRHGFLAELLPEDFVQRGHAIAESAFQSGSDWLSEFSVHDYFGNGDLVMIDLPGHAVGHTGYVLRTESETILYIVDACWDMESMLSGRTLPFLSRRLQYCHAEYATTQEKLKRLNDLQRGKMLACHCPRTQDCVSRLEG
jgi:glyoxylase-like metal-dependent hydrolase (beta-lactamase superfamily II)